MIVIQLSGGLGNQMFQYAFGIALKVRSNDLVYLDESFLKKYPEGPFNTKRKLELGSFNLQLPFIEHGRYFHNEKVAKVFYKLNYRIFLIKNKLVQRIQQINENYEDWLNYDGNSYFIGSFQSYKYLDNPLVKHKILNSFVHSVKLSYNSEVVLKQIINQNSISIHVRRGDYLKKNNISIHGVCDIDYYLKAIEYFNRHLQKFHFFVFSDDILWCRENIGQNTENFTYIDHNVGIDAWQDLILMKNCKHNIIANSSFSWWGAWLNINKNKKVVAPKNWFANGIFSNLAEQLVPVEWVRL